MRIGVTRAVLREEVYLEASRATAAGHTASTDPRVNQMLNRIERQLALKHSWVMQKFEAEKTHSANAQYSTFPATMEDFTKVNEVWTLLGDQWLQVFFGITPEHRTVYDDAARLVPVQRWDLRRPDPDPSNPQYEIWPIPGEDVTLLFRGEEVAGAMTQDSHTCVLDGDALVQACAGELLVKTNPEEAKLKLANADSIIRSIMARQKARKQENFNMGRRPAARPRPVLDYIPPGSI